MGNYQGGGGGFRGGNGGGGKSWGNNRGGDRGPVTMHDATCSECGKHCQVPFRPTGEKPVYCKECFGERREDGDRAPRKDYDNGGKKEYNNDRQSFRPEARPAFKPAPAFDENILKKQLSEISNKLDRLISAMEKTNGVKKEMPAMPAAQAPIVKVAPFVKQTPAAKSASIKGAIKKATDSKKVSAKKVVAKKKK